MVAREVFPPVDRPFVKKTCRGPEGISPMVVKRCARRETESSGDSVSVSSEGSTSQYCSAVEDGQDDSINWCSNLSEVKKDCPLGQLIIMQLPVFVLASCPVNVAECTPTSAVRYSVEM